MRVLTTLLLIFITTVFSAAAISFVKPGDAAVTNVINFKDSAEAKNWVIVNDTVMGGRSRASLKVEENMLVFSGDLSLRNNGGFASTRRIYEPVRWQSKQTIEIQLVGDGRDYQFRLRTNRNVDGIAYVANFRTKKDQIQTLQFAISDFTPQFRGRLVRGAPALDFADIAQMGFMLADKNEGLFTLKIASLKQLNEVI